MRKEKVLQILIIVSRFILGLVFIFSGFVKGVDPMGSAYKFSDYFDAFNLGFLDPLAIPLAFVMAAAEFLIGVSLLFRFRFRLGVWSVAVFMASFTVLTLILALTNPVSDCGCFGDAIIMTNWQTFIKNIILLPFVFIVFFYRKDQSETWSPFYSLGSLLVFGFLFLVLETQAYRHLPQLDFRPYSLGTHIPDKMNIPEGALQDEYQTLLFYENDGIVQEFTEENFPWEDTAWTYVDSRHSLIRKGYEPPIHDFTIVDEYENDITNDILADEGFSFLLVTTHIGKADREALIHADELASWSFASGISFYCMTSSVEDEIIQAREVNNIGFGIYTTDEITLKTIIRSNPGLLLIKNGTIMGKWHYNDFPAIEEMDQGLTSFVMTGLRKDIEKRSLRIFIALFLIMSAFLIYSPFGRNNSR